MKKILLIILLLLLLLFCALFFLFIIIILSVFKFTKKNNIRTFVLNKKTKKIIFFNHKNFKKIEVLSLEEFLNLQERNNDLIEWINKKLKKMIFQK